MKFFDFWWADLSASLSPHRIAGPSGDTQAPKWMLGWAGVSFALLVLLYSLGGYHAGFHLINEAATLFWPGLWEWLTVLGDERLVFAVALLFARRRPEMFWALVLAGLFGLLYTHGLKPWFALLRPPAVLEAGSFHLIGPGHQYRSFPSGHSLTIAFFLGVWVWFLRDWRVRLALVLCAYLIASTRVVVGVHWPVDVLAGVFGGALAAWTGARLSQFWRGGLTPHGHLFCLLLSMAYSSSLFHDDGGYHRVAWFQAGMVTLSYLRVFIDYLWAPFTRWSTQEGTSSTKWPLRYGDLLLCLVMQGVFFTWPQLDLSVTSWFYQQGIGFALAQDAWVQFSYRLFAHLHFYVALVLLLLLAWALFRRWGMLKPTLYLFVVLLIGPGLIVNEVIKAESGRARPLHTELFGGEKAFTPAFVPSDQCHDNCSFVSGHAAMGFYLISLAWVFNHRRWLQVGLLLGGVVGLGRIVQGAHFLSDVVFAFWVVYWTAKLLARLFFGSSEIVTARD